MCGTCSIPAGRTANNPGKWAIDWFLIEIHKPNLLYTRGRNNTYSVARGREKK